MISVGDIEQRLRDRVEDLARQLLPNARREGAYLKVGSTAGEEGQSLVIWLQGAKQGRWQDFGGVEAGDMLDLIAATKGLREKKDAVGWAKQFLGIFDAWSPQDAVRADPAELQRRAAEARSRAEARAAKEAQEKTSKIRGARALFLRGKPIAGTPAEAYLLGRGICLGDRTDVRASPSMPPVTWPGSLRYCGEVYNRAEGCKIPAMLAFIQLADGSHVATHRTYLQQDELSKGGARGWRKIDSANAKMILGPSWGGFVPINKGSSGKPMSAMPEGEPVYMAEGIEDCLVIRMKKPEARIIAGISLRNMGAVVLPAAAKRLVIVADRDDKAAELALLEAAIAAQQARGLQVSIVMPPKGVKDLNDWLRALPADQRGAA